MSLFERKPLPMPLRIIVAGMMFAGAFFIFTNNTGIALAFTLLAVFVGGVALFAMRDTPSEPKQNSVADKFKNWTPPKA